MLRKVVLLCAILCLHVPISYAKIPPEIAVHFPEELLGVMMSLRKVCAEKFDLVPDDIENFNINPDTPRPYKCYMACMMAAAKWITPKGKIMYTKIMNESMFPAIKALMAPALDKCRNIPDGEFCETAFNFNFCIAQADPKNYFLP